MALQRFVETFYPDASMGKITKKPLTESQRKLVESKLRHLREKFELPKDKSVYRVPISRFDWLNGNKRKYEGRLWRRVKESQRDKYVGTFGLADHPPENADGLFKETAMVWLDIELDESNKLIWGYGVPFGTWGRHFEEAIAIGGRPGFSSSGFGELDEDGETVKYDTYELERPADIVLTPSQEVYGDKTMKFQAPDGTLVQITSPSTKEATPEQNDSSAGVVVNVNSGTEVGVDEKSEDMGVEGEPEVVDFDKLKSLAGDSRDTTCPMSNISEPVGASNEDELVAISDIINPVQVSSSKMPAPPLTNPDKDYSESKQKGGNVTLSKMEQKKLEKDMIDFFNEAKREKDPIAKVRLLKEVYGYFNDTSSTAILQQMKKEVFAELTAASKNIRTTIDESLKIKEEIGVETVNDMKTGLNRIAEATFSFNESAEYWKTVAQKLQKTVETLKAERAVLPTIKEYENIVQELEKTDKTTRKLVGSQNKKIQNLKKRLFEERNLSRKIEAETSELKVQLTAMVTAKKRAETTLGKYKEAYSKVVKKNKQLITDKQVILEQVDGFLRGDLTKFGRSQKIPGSAADNIGRAVNFTESQFVESYYYDLEHKYGETIAPFKERILKKKTVREAIAEFTRILTEIEDIRIPKGISGEERKEYLREAHSISIKDPNRKTKQAIRNILDNYKIVRPL